MKVIVLSDTHARSLRDLPARVVKALDGVDLIIHCGDFTSRAVLDELKQWGEVRAVYGNADTAELKQMLPEKELFEIAGKKVGLIHGWGGAWRIAEKVRAVFDDRDIIFYGHSHDAFNGYVDGTLMFNPGMGRESYGLVTIKDSVKTKIIRVCG